MQRGKVGSDMGKKSGILGSGFKEGRGAGGGSTQSQRQMETFSVQALTALIADIGCSSPPPGAVLLAAICTSVSGGGNAVGCFHSPCFLHNVNAINHVYGIL